MQFSINWDLPEVEFRHLVEGLILDARKNSTVIPLPCRINNNGLELQTLLLSQVNCDGCDARCCRSPDFAEFGVPFMDTEYQALVKRIGADKLNNMAIKSVGRTRYIPTPCPFLHKKQCSIYDIRPFICVIYPLDYSAIDDEGSKMMSLDSFCPEARRIAKRIYMTHWKLLKKEPEVMSQMSAVLESARQEDILRATKRVMAQGNDK
jgi:Fe-S-cluster containining protein